MSSAYPVPAPQAAWRAAFRHRDFNCFQAARITSVLGMQMQGVAIGWQVYALTHRPIDLAWVGLAQFLPSAFLSLVTGHAADRFNRRSILLVCHAASAGLSLALFGLAAAGGTSTLPIYAVLVGVGVARAFLGPANQAILPSLVAGADFGNAVAWGSSFWQTATVLGPTLGGLVYAAFAGAGAVYIACAGFSLAALAFVAALRPPPALRGARATNTRASLLAGVRYVMSNPIVLGAMSLDLFAVLLGGATALLPIFARDVLNLGPWALGALRSAPAAGALVTGVLLALRPMRRDAGVKMLLCVALFGFATIVFGLSRNFAVSLFALAVAGAADMVSVFVRTTLVQVATPEAMRGRVSAVNVVCVGASNELGEFESGLTAQFLGAKASVVLGGLGTLAVVALWAWLFPALRRVHRPDDPSAQS